MVESLAGHVGEMRVYGGAVVASGGWGTMVIPEPASEFLPPSLCGVQYGPIHSVGSALMVMHGPPVMHAGQRHISISRVGSGLHPHWPRHSAWYVT